MKNPLHPSDGAAVLRSFCRQRGIGPGSKVMIHSAFSRLAQLGLSPEAFLDVLLDLLGPQGDLVMPTFNWDILHQGESIEFDLHRTPSRMGRLTEVFRQRPGVLRCRNLFNPLAFYGPLAATAQRMANHTSWGPDSPFALLREHDFLILLAGVDYNALAMVHHAEHLAEVPYRYCHDFQRAWLIDDDVRRPLANSTLRRQPGAEIDFNNLAELLEGEGIAQVETLGTCRVRCLRAGALIDFLVPRLREQPDLLLRRGTRQRRVPVLAEGAFSPMETIKDLWLLNRSLAGPGFAAALEHIRERLPLTIHAFPTNRPVLDWLPPKAWNNRGGQIATLEGRVLIDLGDHPLRIAAGSAPFNGMVSRKDLLARAAVDPDRPEALAYRIRYYQDPGQPDWGVSLTMAEAASLVEERFHVVIDTNLGEGELLVGEHVIPGQTPNSIVIAVHLDHPGQCNDNLSGVVVAMDAALRLGTRPAGRHTLRVCFLPETVGSYAYLSLMLPRLADLRCALVVDSVGAGGTPFLMRTLRGDTRLDACARLAMAAAYGSFEEFAFLEKPGFGNDERAFQAPNVGVPAVAVSRYPYPEYHTSLDTPSIIRPEYLRQARTFLMELVTILDADFIPEVTCVGMPQLGRRGLWQDSVANPKGAAAIERLLFFCDGNRSVADLADQTGVDFSWAHRFFNNLEAHGLVRRTPGPPPLA